MARVICQKTQARHLYFQIRCRKVPSCRSAALKLAQPLRNLEAWISCWISMRYTDNCIAFVALCGMLHIMFMLMCKMSWHPARTTGSSKILPSSNSERNAVNNEMDHDRFHLNQFSAMSRNEAWRNPASEFQQLAVLQRSFLRRRYEEFHAEDMQKHSRSRLKAMSFMQQHCIAANQSWRQPKADFHCQPAHQIVCITMQTASHFGTLSASTLLKLAQSQVAVWAWANCWRP